MSQPSIALRQQKGIGLPLMIFMSLLGHLAAVIFFVIVPGLFPRKDPEPFGGGPGTGGNVMWVTTATGLGQPGKPSTKPPKEETEPAPATFLKKATEPEPEEKLPSKTTFIDETKKVKKEQPAAKETLNQWQRKIEGPYGKGTDRKADSEKSGGAGKSGIAAFGPGSGGQGEGAFGSGSGTPFPFPWYIENVITKIELNWRKPFIDDNVQEYVTVLYFVIKRDGKVTQVKTETSSGIPTLDRSAELAVLSSSPFPPLPPYWNEPDLAFRLRFRYTP